MLKNRKEGLRTMSKLFMYGTSLDGIGQLMVMVPNFQPRRSGIVINNYFNCIGGDKDYKLSMINVDNSCRNCGYHGWNFKINVHKKRFIDLAMDCSGKSNNYYLKDNRINLS